jgi:tetratricopeptide (TPR) repeat protein
VEETGIHEEKGVHICLHQVNFCPNYGAYDNIGIAYASSNKFKEAIEAYEKAIEINPDYDTTYYNKHSPYCNKHLH